MVLTKLKVNVHTLDCLAPLRSESPPQKRSGMARRVLKGFHSFTTRSSSAIGMSHTYLPLPSQPQLVRIYRPRARRDGSAEYANLRSI